MRNTINEANMRRVKAQNEFNSIVNEIREQLPILGKKTIAYRSQFYTITFAGCQTEGYIKVKGEIVRYDRWHNTNDISNLLYGFYHQI